MNIRNAVKEDACLMAEVLKILAIKYIVGEFTDQGKSHFLASNDRGSIESFMDEGFRYFIAEINGKLIGFVGTRDHSHLYHLFVVQEYQGMGLGRKLWNHAKSECIKNGNPDIFTVNSSSNAVPIYQALGFIRSAPVQESNGVLYNPMTLDAYS